MNKIYCLIGRNILFVEEKIKELSTKYKIISYQKDSKEFFLELEKNLNQKLFGENFDLVLKNIEKLKDKDLDKLISLLKNLKSSIKIFLIFSQESNSVLSEFKKNKINFEIINVKEPEKYNLEEFILSYFKKNKIKIDNDLVKFIKENYADNPDLLLQDLKKLVSLGKEKVSREDLINLIHLNPNIFKIQEAFLNKNWPLFIHLYKKFILEDKSKNYYESLNVLNLIFNSLIKIYLMKNFPKLKLEGNYYYLQKLKEKSQNLSNEDIKKMINILAKIDRRFKKFMINLKEVPEEISINYLLNR